MSDRICVASKGKNQTRISAKQVLACTNGAGCGGGFPYYAWSRWEIFGFTTGGLYNSSVVIYYY